jgi:hypothetical protein
MERPTPRATTVRGVSAARESKAAPLARSKTDCWEAKRCGRQPGGRNAETLGVCPAAIESRLDGVHGGTNGGRACWVVAGTMCGCKPQGTFAQKLETCEECGFFKEVVAEEFPDSVPTEELLRRLEGDGPTDSGGR